MDKVRVLYQPEDRIDIFSKIHEDSSHSKHTDLNIIAADLQSGTFSTFGVHSSILRNFNPMFDLFIGPAKDILICEIEAVVVEAFIQCLYKGWVNLNSVYSEDMDRLTKVFNFMPHVFEVHPIVNYAVDPLNFCKASYPENSFVIDRPFIHQYNPGTFEDYNSYNPNSFYINGVPMSNYNEAVAVEEGISTSTPAKVDSTPATTVEEACPVNSTLATTVKEVQPRNENTTADTPIIEVQPRNEKSTADTPVKEVQPRYENSTADISVEEVQPQNLATAVQELQSRNGYSTPETKLEEVQTQIETPVQDDSFISPHDKTVEEDGGPKKVEFKTPMDNCFAASKSKSIIVKAIKAVRKSSRVWNPSATFSPKLRDVKKSEVMVTPPSVPTVIPLVPTLKDNAKQSVVPCPSTIQQKDEQMVEKKPSRTPKKSTTSVIKAISKSKDAGTSAKDKEDSKSSKENLKPIKPLRKSPRNFNSFEEPPVKVAKSPEAPLNVKKVKKSPPRTPLKVEKVKYQVSWNNACPIDGCNYVSPRRYKDDVEVHMVSHVRRELEEQLQDVRNNTCPKCQDRKWSNKARFHLHMIMYHDYLQGEASNVLKSFFWSEGGKRKIESNLQKFEATNPLKKLKLE